MSFIRTAVGIVVGIVVIHIIQFAAVQTMAPSVPLFLEQTTQGGPLNAHEHIKGIRDVVVLWVPLVADAAIIAVGLIHVYRKQKITAQQRVGPLR